MLNIMLTPPLVTTLRVNTLNYTFDEVFEKIQEINKNVFIQNIKSIIGMGREI